MTRSVRRSITLLGCVLGAWGLNSVSAQASKPPPKNHAVQATATVQEGPARINLSWVTDGSASSYRISRRSGNSWQTVADLGGNAISWSDSNVVVGNRYEYQLIKNTSAGYRGFGYLLSGIRVPFQDYRGKIILLVENSIAGAVASELNRFQQDLTGDGWVVVRRGVSKSDAPQSVKAVIKSIYDSDPTNVKALLLFGNIPVPYSGNIAPDGHDNHRGAWPADTYYGDMDGTWTDLSVNTRAAERAINHNVPGDGKFDQSVIPSEMELMVGRVDLSNMTCYSNKNPSRSEVDLLRQYLNKNNNYRFGRMNIVNRGLICDNFSDKGTDPIAGSAWRNFPGMVGSSNIVEVPWDGFFPATTQGSYLWSFASGGGSYYYSMGVGTSDDFALKDIRVVFTMFMGSYFGDWNNESNFLRAALGSGDVLTATYSGFPQTLYYPMGMGETIGFCIRQTQNNLTNTIYAPWDQGQGEVHVALMGDPTLRLYPVRPASGLSIATSPGVARLTWSASPDSAVQGYHIYRATNAEGPFTRVTQSLVNGTTFSDSPASGSYVYMLRAVKLEQSPSGTFFNPSQGIFANATVTGTNTPPPQPPSVPSLQAIVASSTRVNLEWTDVANESGYRLERKTGANGSWSEITNTGANVVTFTNENLSAATEYFYRVRAFNNAGNSPYSADVRTVTPAPPQPQATVQFVEIDASTSGDWPRKFGAGGYMIAARSSNLDTSYGASLTGKQDFLWQASSTDSRAPFVTPDLSQRVASAWYGDVITLSLNAGSTTRRVALYALDWDNLARVQRVVVRDAATGATLDTREVNAFGNGKYLVYDIRGSVRISLEKLSGPNALLSGVFVGSAANTPTIDKPLNLILRQSGSAGMTLRILGDPGQKFRIESSSNFQTWTQIATGSLTTSAGEVSIPVGEGTRFIRAVTIP